MAVYGAWSASHVSYKAVFVMQYWVFNYKTSFLCRPQLSMQLSLKRAFSVCLSPEAPCWEVCGARGGVLPRAEEELLLLLLRSANGIFDLEMPLLPSAVRGTMVALRVYYVQPSVH